MEEFHGRKLELDVLSDIIRSMFERAQVDFPAVIDLEIAQHFIATAPTVEYPNNTLKIHILLQDIILSKTW